MYSFYLEMKVAKYAANEEWISYPLDIKRVLQQLAALNDLDQFCVPRSVQTISH